MFVEVDDELHLCERFLGAGAGLSHPCPMGNGIGSKLPGLAAHRTLRLRAPFVLGAQQSTDNISVSHVSPRKTSLVKRVAE